MSTFFLDNKATKRRTWLHVAIFGCVELSSWLNKLTVQSTLNIFFDIQTKSSLNLNNFLVLFRMKENSKIIHRSLGKVTQMSVYNFFWEICLCLIYAPATTLALRWLRSLYSSNLKKQLNKFSESTITHLQNSDNSTDLSGNFFLGDNFWHISISWCETINSHEIN